MFLWLTYMTFIPSKHFAISEKNFLSYLKLEIIEEHRSNLLSSSTLKRHSYMKVASYNSRLENKNKYQSSEIIFFLNIPHEDSFEPIAGVVATPKYEFWIQQLLSQMSKNVDPQLVFLRTGIRRSNSLASQDCTADNHRIDILGFWKCSFWADVWELSLSWWRAIRLRRLFFLISCKRTGKQKVVYHSELTVLLRFCGTVAICPVFPKKQATVCLKVLRVRKDSVEFGWSTITHIVKCCLLPSSWA